jgi:hypothetical protein
VQAGRYAAGLDAATHAGGPTSPAKVDTVLAAAIDEGKPAASTLRVVGTMIEAGQTNFVALNLGAQGNENAMGFSLSYNPAVIQFVRAEKGTIATNATLNVNTNQTALGRVGFALALPAGQTFAVGLGTMLKVYFASIGGTTSAVSFVDQPIAREVVDATAATLNAAYVNGTVTLGLWNGAVDAGNGWRYLEWFGYFNDTSSPWIYHLQHRWLATVAETTTSIWFYPLDGMGWLWTSETVYPWLYKYNQGTWLYYLEDTSAPRWFFNWTSQQWEPHNP